MYKITLYDMNSSPVSDGTAVFFTEDIDGFERQWASLCSDDGERIDRFRRSKAGECVTDYGSDDPDLNIVQEDPSAEVLFEKQFTLHDVTFCSTNAYGWQEKYHIDDWHCFFRWIRFQNALIRVFSYKADGVCMHCNDTLRHITCFGNPVLINNLKYIVRYDCGEAVADYPLTYEDFAENSLETYCWLTGEWFETEEAAADNFRTFEVTDEVMDRMFWDVIGEAG